MIAFRNLDLNGMEGKPVTFFLQAMCHAYSSISEITLASYLKQPGLSSRISGHLALGDKRFLDEVSRVSAATHAPLWSVFPYLALESGKHLDFFVDSALTHFHGPRAEKYTISAMDLLANGIDTVIRQLPPAHGLTVCSQIKLTDGTRFHIPMMDFICPVSDANEELLLSTLRKLGQEKGILVNSGNSYHFYGCALLTEDEWWTFLGHSLLLSPVTDPRYIAHRIIDGYCNLRILDAIQGAIPCVSVTFQNR